MQFPESEKRERNPVLAVILLMAAWLLGLVRQAAEAGDAAVATLRDASGRVVERAHVFAMDARGAASIGAIISVTVAIIVSIVGAVIGVSVLAELAPTYFTSLAGIVNVFTNESVTTGDSTADSIKPILGTLLAIIGLFGLLGVATVVVALRIAGSKKSSGF